MSYNFGARMSAAIQAFREPNLITQPLNSDDFGDWYARQNRYALYWALYENSVYRNVHTFAKSYRAAFGLYQHIRSIYSPAQRLGTFYQTHLMGGMLDPKAGTGDKIASALPIAMDTDSTALRAALARLWRDSNWNTKKDVYTLQGSIYGDIGLEVVHDTIKERVYLEVVHPGKIESVDMDNYGNVKGYTRCESKPDPTGKQKTVNYKEVVRRDGDLVVYQTFLNDMPYDWSGNGAEWLVAYGFVPLVMVKHSDVGMDWGWSVFHAGLPKFREVDDLASALNDYVRKMVNAPMLYNFAKSAATPTVPQTANSATNLEPGRQQVPALYVNQESAKGQPLVTELNIAAVGGEIERLLTALEEEYPELKVMKLQTAGGDASGRALRYAQQPAGANAQRARNNYDAALVKAHQMAIAIGGEYGYDGYVGFGLDSYAAGKLDHSIGERPVFAVDPLDRIEEDNAFWTSAKVAVDAGYDLELYLADQGWDEAKIAKYLSKKAERDAKAQAQFQQQQAANNQNADTSTMMQQRRNDAQQNGN
jgi:hypothetical protein